VARESLEVILREARAIGFAGFELEARLALAELEVATDPTAAKEILMTLATEARQRGFLRLADQADRVRETVGL